MGGGEIKGRRGGFRLFAVNYRRNSRMVELHIADLANPPGETLRRAGLLLLTAAVLLAAGCATDQAEVTGSIPKMEPKPLLPAPPPPLLPDKPRQLSEPECKSLVSQIQACSQRVKDKEKKTALQRRAIEVAETLGSMDAGQRKATCKADLPQWRKDCGAP